MIESSWIDQGMSNTHEVRVSTSQIMEHHTVNILRATHPVNVDD